MTTATPRWAALLLLAALASPVALAQTGTLGDEFILFVDGTNVMIPTVEAGNVVDDPLDAGSGNKVMRFNAGAYVESGFAWSRSQGIDASANVGATYGESDTLYFRLLSSVENASVQEIRILLGDATNDSGIPRTEAEATGAADYLMRLVWTIPAEMHDGQWHDLAIPLPPATYAALEEARGAGVLMDGAENWAYTGAWSNGGFGVGSVGGFDPPTDDPLFKDFDWTNLYRIGPHWNNDVGGGPIYMDDVYIGGPNTDPSIATAQPTAMSGVSFSPNGTTNRLSWNAVDGAGGYNVYTSLEPITNINADGVTLAKRIGFGEPNEFNHRFEVPHPELTGVRIYYAVTTLSNFGVENSNVAASAGSISNGDLVQKPFIRQLLNSEADALFDALANGAPSDDEFPAAQPAFLLDSSHRTITEGTIVPDDSDVSGTFKIGYSDANEWFVYGEITDDLVDFGPAGLAGGELYQYDSVELEIAHYDVRLVDDGDILVGSPHPSFQRGDEPDYQIRIAGRDNESGTIVGTSTFINYDGGSDNRELDSETVQQTTVEKTATGWRFLTLLPMDQIQAPGDVTLLVPGSDELQIIAFSIAINDADASGLRESQIVYSIRPGVNNQWYHDPSQWGSVAIAGRDLRGIAVENGTESNGFALAQSVPNPAIGTADIAFSLGGPRQVTLDVFNVLGQHVMTVAEGQLAAGPHEVSLDTSGLASGVYVYRLSAGDYVATRRMTVVR